MAQSHHGPLTAFSVLLVAFAAALIAADIKVETKHDPTMNFKTLKTYAWAPEARNQMMVNPGLVSDVEATRKTVEPVVVAAVDRELARKKFTLVSPETADLLMSWHVAIDYNINTTMMGQFYPQFTDWSMPVGVGGSTNYMRAYEQGSLILDAVAPSRKAIVWFGVAQAELKRENTPTERAARISEAVQKILGKFPPK
jgi:hypothetical protein